MILNCICPQCRKPLAIPLPDSTTEQEAERIAQNVICADCWRGSDKTREANQSGVAGFVEAGKGGVVGEAGEKVRRALIEGYASYGCDTR